MHLWMVVNRASWQGSILQYRVCQLQGKYDLRLSVSLENTNTTMDVIKVKKPDDGLS